ncbi:helix-turn-helix transcriptional regulator [Ferrimonas futtsuensis]|uniref:helix-turn-helix transcriptional regulator n=1 Tax=Ferrimonas futtsuensis TaxID=364764 RepID=UPI000A057126|nr:AlpA family phage regulatory protein [Ferrimonas futtsuensis]
MKTVCNVGNTEPEVGDNTPPHQGHSSTPPPHDRLIREKECRQISGLTRQRRLQLEKKGRFPLRIHIGERAIAWRLSEVQGWINQVASTQRASFNQGGADE